MQDVLERCYPDCTVDARCFVCGTALRLLAMSRRRALFHQKIASASLGPVKVKAPYMQDARYDDVAIRT